MDNKLTKTFGTFLRNNYTVNLKASKYHAVIKKDKLLKDLPPSFNPIEKWGDYLSPIYDQKECGNCWAVASVTCLADRFSLLSLGQNKPLLSVPQVTICDGVISSKVKIDENNRGEVNMKAHSSQACTGNTIYNAVEYLYMYGAVERECFSKELLKQRGFDVDTQLGDDPSIIPYCSQILGVEWDKCIDMRTPARFFRSIVSYNIGSDVEEIKNEIFHWGPVITGMIIYTNFLNKYDGISIYMGPEKGDMVEGGHSVKIVGWGVENDIKFWWVANSWGAYWGRSGYFKMKMNISECQLEKNVVAFIPDIPTFKLSFLDYTQIDTDFNKNERIWFNVDNNTGYKFNQIKFMKNNGVDVVPLFDVSKLPDYSNFYAGRIKTHPKTLLSFSLLESGNLLKLKRDSDDFILILLIVIVPIFLGVIFKYK